MSQIIPSFPEETTRLEISLEHMVCGGCGCVFAVPGVVLRAKRERNEAWFCPNGHACTDSGGETFVDREEIQSLSRKLQRLGDGTCPYCRKHFKRLDRHLAWKHQEEQMNAN